MAPLKRRLKRGLAASVLAIGATLVPGLALAESLADALIMAYRHSGLLEQNRALLRAADEDVAVAVGATRPVISYSLSASAYEDDGLANLSDLSTTASITADLLLYDFGDSKLAIDAAKETVLATREALIDVEQQVLLSAASAYLDVLNDFALVELGVGNVRVIESELRAAQDQFEVGEITRTDVAITESRLAEARSGLASARGQLEIAKEQYRNAVGEYPGTLVFPSNLPQLPATADAAMEVAERTHPTIRQAIRQVRAADINVTRAELAMKPTLSTGATVSLDDEGDTSTTLSLSLSGTLYQGGRLTSMLRAAIASRDQARAALHLARHAIELELRSAWTNLQVADASLTATREQVRSATLALRGVQEEAKLGARTTLDVLNAEQELLDARSAEVTAKTQRTTAVFAVLDAMGLMTVDHLDLGITTYDPAAYYNAVKNAPTHLVSPQGEKLDRVLKALNK